MTERLSEDYFDDMQKITRHYAKSNNIDLNTGGNDFQDIIDKLAEYETAEEEGRLVVLPCKIGDMVYVIAPNHRLCEAKHDCDEYDYENYLPSWCENYCPYGYKGVGVIKDIVSHIEIRDNGICYCTTNCGYLYDDKVFLTREEAEKALREMEEKS